MVQEGNKNQKINQEEKKHDRLARRNKSLNKCTVLQADTMNRHRQWETRTIYKLGETQVMHVRKETNKEPEENYKIKEETRHMTLAEILKIHSLISILTR